MILFEPKTYVDFDKLDTPTIEEAVNILVIYPLRAWLMIVQF